jgi:hypothetical protein
MTMIRQVLAIFVLTRMCASLALILLDGASTLLEAAAFTIALIGLAPVALVIGRMRSVGRASLAPQRELGGTAPRAIAAR